MVDGRKIGKRALILAMLCAAAGGVWFGRCSRHVPAEASSGTASTWTASSASPSTPAAPPASAPGAASLEKMEPQHFDVTENPNLKGGVKLREMDREIFDQLNHVEQLDRARMADVFPDRPYKVRFIGNVEQRHVGVVLIDLKRNGTIDERWQLGEGGEVKRTVPHDPYAIDGEVRYTLGQGKWQVR